MSFRIRILYSRNWISLKPFDLYYDTVDAIKRAIRFIRINLIKFKNWFGTKVYTPVRDTIKKYVTIVYNWIKKIVNYIVGKITGAAQTVIDKVAKPFYLYCVKKIILIKNIVMAVFRAAKNLVIFVFKLIQKILVSFFDAIVAILKNLNKLYFNILLESRKSLMRFGIIG